MLLGWGESRETENSLPVSCDLRLRLMQYHSVLVLSGIELMLLYLPFFFFFLVWCYVLDLCWKRS